MSVETHEEYASAEHNHNGLYQRAEVCVERHKALDERIAWTTRATGVVIALLATLIGFAIYNAAAIAELRTVVKTVVPIVQRVAPMLPPVPGGANQ